MADDTEWSRIAFEGHASSRAESRRERRELLSGWLRALAEHTDAGAAERVELRFAGPFSFVLARRSVRDVRAAAAATGLSIDVRADHRFKPRWVEVAVRHPS